ncbi:MAG: zinc ribbon domain-containing protein [Proteobacteria bacterium]|nr:zinc ribbon domain-containing protein [Pseudomonadota bacterium]
MPFYEYQCEKCGHHLEVMQKISDASLKKCPECAKPALKRLMSAPVFRLKGSGWYETDFKSDQDGKRNLADKAEAEAPKEEKKDDKKEDKKADAPAAESSKPADKPAAAVTSSTKTPAAKPARVSKPKTKAKVKTRRR